MILYFFETQLLEELITKLVLIFFFVNLKAWWEGYEKKFGVKIYSQMP